MEERSSCGTGPGARDPRMGVKAWSSPMRGQTRLLGAEAENEVEIEILDPEGGREHFSRSGSESLLTARDLGSLLASAGSLLASPRTLSSTTRPWLLAAPRTERWGSGPLRRDTPASRQSGFPPQRNFRAWKLRGQRFSLTVTRASWPPDWARPGLGRSSGLGLALAEGESIRISTPGSAGSAPRSRFLAPDLPWGQTSRRCPSWAQK